MSISLPFGRVAILISLLVNIIACNMPASPNSETAPPPQTFPTALPTITPTMDGSLRVPEVISTDIETIYTQPERSRLGGRDLTYWPDGNIGFVSDGDQYRFFAANGSLTAIMLGSFENPGETVIANRLAITGASSEFGYLAGGPIYRDSVSGMLLMFYHAERHFGGDGRIFHAALGLAASHDGGMTFQNLGIILETNAAPDKNAPCCADMGGAPFVVKDGNFHVYFIDRMQDLSNVSLAVATAPVDEVVSAALEGKTSPWFKYYRGEQEAGISGRSSPLELGNPRNDWISASYNTALDQFIMVSSSHSDDQSTYSLNLAVSPDGYQWSPRVVLTQDNRELTYPSIVSVEGDPLTTGLEFYIYYVSASLNQFRWNNADLLRMTVTLSGDMEEVPREWEFVTDAGGWLPQNQVGRFETSGGSLLIEATGPDPYIHSQTLGLDGSFYHRIETRMKVGQGGTGQFFFTSAKSPFFSEAQSVRFPVHASDDFIVYTVDMSRVPAWNDLIATLRFDPTDQATTAEIDYIRLIP